MTTGQSVTFQVPKPKALGEDEDITSFSKWQSALKFYLSSINMFAPFLEPAFTWQKSSVPNRGLTSDADTVPEDRRKTAAQKSIILDQMLGVIAQLFTFPATQ